MAEQCKSYADYLYLELDLDTYQFFKNPDCVIGSGVDVDKLSCAKLRALQGNCVFKRLSLLSWTLETQDAHRYHLIHKLRQRHVKLDRFTTQEYNKLRVLFVLLRFS